MPFSTTNGLPHLLLSKCILVLSIGVFLANSQASLYTDSPNIIELNANTFNVVYNSPASAYFVQFYKPSCGHCRSFAPNYKQLALDTQRWSPMLILAVLSCDTTSNLDICRQNAVTHTPFFKYYPSGARSLVDGITVNWDSKFQVSVMKSSLATLVQSDYMSHPSPNWHNMQWLTGSITTSNVWSNVANQAQHLVIIFPNNNAQDNALATQLILELSRVPGVATRRSTNGSPWQVTKYPSIILLSRTQTQPLLKTTLSSSTADEILRVANIALNDYVTTASPNSVRLPSTTLSPQQYKDRFYVSETDMLKSIHHALYKEVRAFKTVIQGQDFVAMRKFLKLLKDFLPPATQANEALSRLRLPTIATMSRMERARALITNLYDYMHSLTLQSAQPSINVEQWVQLFENAERSHQYPFPSENTPYEHCRGSAAHLRGYTCGLWTTFHAVTVQAYLTSTYRSYQQPAQPLYAIQAWVQSYFSCDDCKQHFLNMTNVDYPIATNVQYPSQTVLYLWQAHNMVNARLHHDQATNDPQFPKLQFPDDRLCGTCKTPEHTWYTYRVLNYLIKYYTHIRSSQTW